jgi:hypothetical protein
MFHIQAVIGNPAIGAHAALHGMEHAFDVRAIPVRQKLGRNKPTPFVILAVRNATLTG